MLDLYLYHSHPERLIGHEERETLIPDWALDRAIEMKARFPEGEAAILRDPEVAAWYAIQVIKDRWPEAEKGIASNARATQMYAREFFSGRWPEGEAAIMKDAWTAVDYARYNIKGRWPEGEAVIKNVPSVWEKYKEQFNIVN